eukprot:211129-Rhodomonas_salina.2
MRKRINTPYRYGVRARANGAYGANGSGPGARIRRGGRGSLGPGTPPTTFLWRSDAVWRCRLRANARIRCQ